MLSRPPSSPLMAILKPMPSSPSRLSTGTRASSKITWRVGCAFQPIFRSLRPEGEAGRVLLDDEGRNPGRAALRGAHHGDVDVRHAGAGDELLDPVHHVMVAVRTARVFSAAASEPAPGSVRQ